MAGDDLALAERWSAGDMGAGDQLVRRHFGVVFRFLRRRVGDDAEDVSQRTFEAILGEGRRYRGEGSFRAYLLGIARNQALMHLRRHRRHEARVASDEPGAAPSVGSPSRHAAAREEHKVLLRALRTLPVDLQIALELFYWEDMSNAEIATVLDIPRSTVTSRLWRARELLREALRTMDISEALRRSTVGDLEGWARSLRALVDPDAA